MGKDQEVPEHFGMLHEKNLTPHRAIWALAIISAIIGCIAVTMAFGDAGAPADAAIAGFAAWRVLQLRILHPRQNGGVTQLTA